MFLNKNLMNAVSAAGGGGLVSKASAPMSLLSDKVPAVQSALSKAQDVGGVDLSSILTAQGSWSDKVGSLANYVKSSESTMADRLGVASEYRQIKSIMSNEQVEGCMDFLGVSGIGLGMFNELFDAAAAKMAELAAKLEAYVDGLLSPGELSAFIARIKGEIEEAMDSIQAVIDEEMAKLNEMVGLVKQSALVQQLTALWNNPCTKAIVGEVMPPQYATALDSPSVNNVRSLVPDWPAHMDIG
ncbi:hypothetical protein H10PHJ05_41 [Aeromonas phage HJ05]|nr:hypothetical protein H10PHJ05_41 [Aeromonas phage HJ05]